jgi:hypothetical protein
MYAGAVNGFPGRLEQRCLYLLHSRRVAHPQQVQTNRVMHGQIGDDNSESEVIPFARGERTSTSDGADQLDKAGQTILQMLHRAAGVAEENSRHALLTAQKLSDQLRAAEDRVGERGHRSPLISKEQSRPSSGSIASILRLKTDFFRREKPIVR